MALYLRRTLSDKETYLMLVNRPKTVNKSYSKYRGVTSGSKNYPYRASLFYAGRRYYIGSFKTELEAAAAYNRLALEIIGPHALINELPPGYQ